MNSKVICMPKDSFQTNVFMMYYYQNIFDLYTYLITCIPGSHKNIMGDKRL